MVLSFDPDAAGQGAAARSSEMLVAEGFQVNVAMLPAGDDPDNYIRQHGAAAYQEQLRNSQQYLEYLLDRSAAGEDLSTDEGRRAFLGKMLTVAARIPDAAASVTSLPTGCPTRPGLRKRWFGRKSARRRSQRRRMSTEVERRVPAMGQIKVAERGLIWALMHRAEAAVDGAARARNQTIWRGWPTREILRQARSLQDMAVGVIT